MDNLTTIHFANTITDYTAHTLKFNMKVKNWPFRSLQSSLAIVLDTQAQTQSENPCETTQSATDETGNLKWITISLNGVTVYLIAICYKTQFILLPYQDMVHF